MTGPSSMPFKLTIYDDKDKDAKDRVMMMMVTGPSHGCGRYGHGCLLAYKLKAEKHTSLHQFKSS